MRANCLGKWCTQRWEENVSKEVRSRRGDAVAPPPPPSARQNVHGLLMECGTEQHTQLITAILKSRTEPCACLAGIIVGPARKAGTHWPPLGVLPCATPPACERQHHHFFLFSLWILMTGYRGADVHCVFLMRGLLKYSSTHMVQWPICCLKYSTAPSNCTWPNIGPPGGESFWERRLTKCARTNDSGGHKNIVLRALMDEVNGNSIASMLDCHPWNAFKLVKKKKHSLRLFSVFTSLQPWKHVSPSV